MYAEKTIETLVYPDDREQFEGYITGTHMLPGGEYFGTELSPSDCIDHSFKEGCVYLRDTFLQKYEFPDKVSILLRIAQGQERSNRLMALIVLGNVFEPSPGIAPYKVVAPRSYHEWEYLPLVKQVEGVCVSKITLDRNLPDEWESILALKALINLSQWEIRCLSSSPDLPKDAINRQRGVLARQLSEAMRIDSAPQSTPYLAALALAYADYVYNSQRDPIRWPEIDTDLDNLQLGYFLRAIEGEKRSLQDALRLLLNNEFHTKPFGQFTEVAYYTQLLLAVFKLVDLKILKPQQVAVIKPDIQNWRGYAGGSAWPAWQEALRIRASKVTGSKP